MTAPSGDACALSPPVRTLIVDDEPLARQALRGLSENLGCLDLIGEACDGTQASDMIETLQPELVFLDVKLPGTSGIEVLANAVHQPVAILTTAFDSYALEAFELGAIDYLTKPFGEARLRRALERAIPQIQSTRARGTGHPSEASTAKRLHAIEHAARPLDTLYVRERNTVVPVATKDIARLEADGDFVAVCIGTRRYLVYLNLGDLARQLDESRFVRIHRSHVVNLDHVLRATAIDANRIEVQLRDGTRIAASRSGTRLLRERMRNR